MSDSEVLTTVVVSFDRWPWPALGCYGHEWIDTPSWDQLAADGFLFDRCVATINKDERVHEKLWNDFLPRLRLAGVQTSLLRESGTSPLGCDSQWSHIREIAGNDAPDAPHGERSFAKLIAAAAAEIQSSPESPRLVWIHGVGLPECCPILRDALELYAADFAEEGLNLAAMTDEELVDHELTRATLLSLLDHWLGELLAVVRTLPGRKKMTVFAWEGAIWEPAPRPTALIAPFDPQQSQVPCIVSGDGIEPGRTAALATTADLFPTIAQWFSLPPTEAAAGCDLEPLIAGSADGVRNGVIHRGEDQGAIWTNDDVMLFARHGDDWNAQRFLWPEDGWAINDIAFQTPDITALRIRQFVESSRDPFSRDPESAEGSAL
ncbi:MAG: hypothetical protein Q8K78_16990 [Planctomycetaceae bacterium]|nr:hypothetical protein [Planctomycetaceae bacterium]